MCESDSPSEEEKDSQADRSRHRLTSVHPVALWEKDNRGMTSGVLR